MEISIEKTKDIGFINSVLSHPRIYPHISDDGTAPRERCDCSGVVDNPAFLFLMPVKAGERCGLFMTHQHSAVMFEVHTCILPAFWGLAALEAGKKLIEWVFERTTCRKLITYVPAYNKLAKRLAINCGMKPQGVVEKSFLKDGILHDQFLYGVGKE